MTAPPCQGQSGAPGSISGHQEAFRNGEGFRRGVKNIFYLCFEIFDSNKKRLVFAPPWRYHLSIGCKLVTTISTLIAPCGPVGSLLEEISLSSKHKRRLRAKNTALHVVELSKPLRDVSAELSASRAFTERTLPSSGNKRPTRRTTKVG